MTLESRYDAAQDAPLTDVAAEGPADPVGAALPVDGMGCHAGADEMAKAARLAGKSEILDQYAADYPQGPHDKPQSMCPAFGSLRVGLRMRRVATVLSGSACCVYGLTFVSHFYGARRSVGYVPFNSETLVTGKLFEDIRDAVHELADPDRYLRAHRLGRAAEAAAQRDQRCAHRRHRRARLWHPDPCRGQGCAGRGDAEICPR
jgi:chlorophyllide a reductase subunit Y